jgi:hypothetical protein
MKKRFAFIICMIWMAAIKVFAQDTLITEIGKHIAVTISEISPTEIKYKHYDDMDGPQRIIRTERVMAIKYVNGTIDSLDDMDVNTETMAQRGKEDARQYYHKYKGARAATMITTIVVGGVSGLVPAIICSATPPKTKHLGYVDDKLMENREYSNAYRKEARHIKVKKVWMGYVTGIIIDVAALVVVLAIVG